MLIDGLQYCNWSEKIFRELRDSNVTAIHVTISYHEQFRDTVSNFEQWNKWFEQYPSLIMPAYFAEDVEKAKKLNKTAIIFGFQNPSPIEDDIGLVEILHRLGGRFMQLSYNNQSLLATGCYEKNDPGITRMGKEVIKEMNRVGMVVDMSHSSEISTLQAIELSERPIVISHANPSFWHSAKRNKSNSVLSKLAESNGILGFSLYPHHLNNSSNCSLEDFCSMIARTVDIMGIDHVGFGSDLCQDQPDSIVEWMRVGKWTKDIDYGEGSASNPGFPSMPIWFRDNRDWHNIIMGLKDIGFNEEEVDKIKGKNWLNFFKNSFRSL